MNEKLKEAKGLGWDELIELEQSHEKLEKQRKLRANEAMQQKK